jgi:hypothetical protein
MKRLLLLALAAASLLALTPGAQAAPFGLHGFEVAFTEFDGTPATQAGGHPYAMKTSFFANTVGSGKSTQPTEQIKDVLVSQIEGFAGNPSAVPACSTLDFLEKEDPVVPECADGSAIGTINIYIRPPEEGLGSLKSPVYLLDPAPGSAARLGFWVAGVPVTIDASLSESSPYELQAAARNISQILSFFGSELTLWGTPADPRHDNERGACYHGVTSCEAGTAEVPFLTLPRACGRPLATNWAIDPWAHPGAFVFGSAPTPELVGCDRLSFAPTIAAQPTSRAAQSPTGLDFALDVEDEGLTNPHEGALAASDIEKTVVTLPKGMTINASQAEGLEVCSEEALARERSGSPPGEGCPEASKIGTIELETPLLEGHVLKGSLYVAEPYKNLAGNSLIAIYIVVRDPGLGVHIVQPVRVEPDPATGQLIAVSEDMPQQPFSHFRLHFREGARSPLISPPGCGSFDVSAELFPSSGGEPTSSSSSFQIVSGPGESPCPSGRAPFAPGFEAGTLNNAAKAYSPFDMRLTRKDGEQDMTKFSAVLPPGVVGKIAGIPYCPEAAITRAKARTGPHGGQEELDSPSCPTASKIGRTVAGAGVGSQLTYVGGSLYLAGPFHGDPLSVVSVTPAVAGPFDAGTVVVRVALTLNPKTGEVEADGSASDPIPHILKGIPLNVRDLRVYADRPEFTLNATSCEEELAKATLWGGGTALLPLPETPVSLGARYQAAGCARLGFRPALALRLLGASKRGSFPALHLVLSPRAEDANLNRLALRFPHSEFIEQGHFRTICTRVQYAAGAGNGAQCPTGSVYGQAKVWTPLLAEPLSGPVYLRSSSHNLPDAVIAFQGPPSLPIHFEVDTRIDSVHGGLRAIAADLPDAPVSKAVVDMRGGQKGLFVNSTDLCLRKHRAGVVLKGQNGKLERSSPLLVASGGCAKGRGKSRSHRLSR